MRKLGSVLLLCSWIASFALPQHAWLTVLLGFPLIFFLNGYMSLQLFAHDIGSRLHTFLFSVGLSIIELLALSMLANGAGRLVGMEAPLNSILVPTLFGAIFAAKLVLGKQFTPHENKRPRQPMVITKQDVILSSASVLSVVLCILGTIRLNNYSSNTLTMVGLVINALSIIFISLYHKKLSTLGILLSLAATTVNLLFMNSLRSWGIPGQDLKNEFKVYTITAQHGYWSMNNLRDPYNACLSIAVLPVVAAKMLGISALVFFKVAYQVLFVTTVMAIFAFLRQYVSKFYAYIGAIFFISLPTFSVDLPLQARQMTAFLFLSLALLAWFSKAPKPKHWQWIFLLMSVGVVFSHYSTSYIYVGALISFLVARQGIRYLRKDTRPADKDHHISAWVIIAIALTSFTWLTLYTGVSSGLSAKVGKSVDTLSEINPSQAGSSVKGKLFRSLTSGSSDSTDKMLEAYVADTKTVTTSTKDIPIKLVDTTLPSPALIKDLKQVGVNIPRFVSTSYYIVDVVIFELLIVIGLLRLVFGTRIRKDLQVPEPLILFAAIMFGFLATQILLPGISKEYGITRTFIQAFMVLVLPFLIGFEALLKKRQPSFGAGVITACAVVFYVLYSGLLPQLTGGLRPQLSLNNSGHYYSTFYHNECEYRTFAWAGKNIPKNRDLRAPDFSYSIPLAVDGTYRFAGTGILPFQVRDTDYVLMNKAQTKDGVVYLGGLGAVATPISERDFPGRQAVYSNTCGTLLK